MGCGVSQVSPLDEQPPPRAWQNLQFFLSGRQNVKNGGQLKAIQISQYIQTDDDIVGFKCQHSQTDNTIMDDQEFECMILALQEALLSNPTDKIIQDDDDDEAHGESLLGHGLRQRFAIAHASVQATPIKRDKSNQTKFGSIDHRFDHDKPDAKVLDQLMSFIEHEQQQKQRSFSARTRLKDAGKKLCLQGKQDEQFQFCLESIMGKVRMPKKRDVELQTVNDILTDE